MHGIHTSNNFLLSPVRKNNPRLIFQQDSILDTEQFLHFQNISIIQRSDETFVNFEFHEEEEDEGGESDTKLDRFEGRRSETFAQLPFHGSVRPISRLPTVPLLLSDVSSSVGRDASRNTEQFRWGRGRGPSEHLAIHLETGPAPPSGGRIPARSDRIFVSDLSFTRKRAPSSLPLPVYAGARGCENDSRVPVFTCRVIF